MHISEFDFDLPERLIAQTPLASRSASRLLDARTGAAGEFFDRSFSDLGRLLRPGDLLIFNDTRVIRARLFGRKGSGGQIEILVERVLDEFRVIAQIRASHAPKAGSEVVVGEDVSARVLGRVEGFTELRFDRPVEEVLAAHGALPLPPYIAHSATKFDEERYQTIFARESGAVAAPTAGLHFDEAILASLKEAGVACETLTLHVGAGTFVPVRVDDLTQHVMHAERYIIAERLVEAIARTRAANGRVVAVGTTTLRALESAALADGAVHAGAFETRLFVTPGFQFKVADLLLTNFHLPRSTLLMLVSAFAGMETIRAAYRHAIAAEYRFFSYGDAMLLERM